jgi:hypothetical protein
LRVCIADRAIVKSSGGRHLPLQRLAAGGASSCAAKDMNVLVNL